MGSGRQPSQWSSDVDGQHGNRPQQGEEDQKADMGGDRIADMEASEQEGQHPVQQMAGKEAADRDDEELCAERRRRQAGRHVRFTSIDILYPVPQTV